MPARRAASGSLAPRQSGALSTATAAAGSSTATPLSAAQDIARPNLQKSDLRPGDVYLWVKEDDPSHPKEAHVIHAAIYHGQRLQGAMDRECTGDPQVCHAGIWTKNPGNPGRVSAQGMGEPEIVEASGGNRRVQGTTLSPGLYKIYRPTDENHGDWAAQVAMGWADKREIPYDKPSAALALVRSKAYDAAAAGRAVDYAEAAFAEHPVDTISGAFCSMLVAAAYQAAGGQIDAARGTATPSDQMPFPVNAMGSSVRTLDHVMNSSPQAFTFLGHLRVAPGEQLYEELPAGAAPRDPPLPEQPGAGGIAGVAWAAASRTGSIALGAASMAAGALTSTVGTVTAAASAVVGGASQQARNLAQLPGATLGFVSAMALTAGPAAGRQAILEKINALSDGARTLLQISALAGDRMSTALVARLSPTVAAEITAHTAELEAAGLWADGRPADDNVIELARQNASLDLHPLVAAAIDDSLPRAGH